MTRKAWDDTQDDELLEMWFQKELSITQIMQRTGRTKHSIERRLFHRLITNDKNVARDYHPESRTQRTGPLTLREKQAIKNGLGHSYSGNNTRSHDRPNAQTVEWLAKVLQRSEETILEELNSGKPKTRGLGFA
jgi:hypothetical protein